MAYCLFNNHAHAQQAIARLSERPVAEHALAIATPNLTCAASESERILRGREGSHGDDFLGKLMGKKAVRMHDIQNVTHCNRAMLTGKGMKGYGVTDDDSRLHLVLCVPPGAGPEMINLAKPLWTEQVTTAFNEIYGGKGPSNGGVFVPPYMPPNGGGVLLPGAPLPPGVPAGGAAPAAVVYVQGPNGVAQPALVGGGAAAPAAGGTQPGILKIPLVLKRVDADTKKIFCEAVALVGSELRWQPWCKVVGGEDWKAYPLRWGRGVFEVFDFGRKYEGRGSSSHRRYGSVSVGQ